jgi:hypothetical protein
MIQNNIFRWSSWQNHHIKVILCSVLPANYFYWSPKKDQRRYYLFKYSIKRYATANNIPYVDYYPAMADAEKDCPNLFR